MRCFGEAVLGLVILGVAVAAAADPPAAKDKPSPLTPVFRPNGGGWQFAANYRNASTGDEDLPTLLEKSSIVLDGKVHARQVVRFGGRSNLPPGESWSLTIDMVDYISREEVLSEGRHTLTLKFGSRMFGPVEFVWAPGGK